VRAFARRTAGAISGYALRPDIAIAHRFHRPPYGGSNQFLLALAGELRRRGLRVGANVSYPGTRGAIVNSFLFDESRLASMVKHGARVLHRVDGPVSVYRGHDDGTDARIVEVNRKYATATVFQSRYSLERHRQIGIELLNPVVITNAVDPTIFNRGVPRARPGDRIRLIATAWSDNPNKGGSLYAWLDEHLDRDRYEFTFAGRLRTPLRHARLVPPVDSQGVAALLRDHDVYVMASRHESCSNALIEALACGLPVAYVESGSNSEIVGGAGLGFQDESDVLSSIDAVADGLEDFRARIAIPSIAEVADRYLEVLGLMER
jgi:glycosyltransferase involved in cell wall biosynthesis